MVLSNGHDQARYTFNRLLLQSQNFLGPEDGVRIKHEMRYSSTSAVVALSSLRRRQQYCETASKPFRIDSYQLTDNLC